MITIQKELSGGAKERVVITDITIPLNNPAFSIFFIGQVSEPLGNFYFTFNDPGDLNYFWSNYFLHSSCIVNPSDTGEFFYHFAIPMYSYMNFLKRFELIWKNVQIISHPYMVINGTPEN